MNLRIRDMREEKGMTQQQIAEYLNCDQSLYSKYERGEREVPLEIMVNLATLFETSIDYLYAHVARANELVQICQEKLRKVDGMIKEIIE